MARVAPGVLSRTAIGQQMMELRQCRYADQRLAELHCAAHRRVEHPPRDHRNLPTRSLDVNKLAAYTLVTTHHANRAPLEAVPAVMDLNRLPDMGRMRER